MTYIGRLSFIKVFLITLCLTSVPQAWAQPISFTITELTQIGTDIDGFVFDGPIGDFYAKVTIDGTTISTKSDRYDFGFEFGAGYIFPWTLRPDQQKYWLIGTDTDGSIGTADFQIQIWDQDDVSDDDKADIKPGPGSTLNLTVDLSTGGWTGDVDWPQNCAQGSGGDAVRICWEIGLLSASGDADGDGLYDFWETGGLDVDGDGTVDVDLPAFGADPLHKDMFLELDWMTGNTPTRAGIQAVKMAFANAPVDAGTNGSSRPGGRDAQPNPDGLPGINLWVDTGNLIDPAAVEDLAGVGSCSDGIDNGFDGVADSTDSDCLVGDNLGGGNQLIPQAISDLNTAFYNVKQNNFSSARRPAFRYAISAAPGFEDGSSAGNSCSDGVDNGGGDEDGDGNPEIDGQDPDCWPWGGGWGEIGGNDFIEYNHGGGTIMHELGHTLNLLHGGDVNNNCKPNYVSVMNYDNQFGISQVGGGGILDYSPPRIRNEDRAGQGSCVDSIDNGTDGLIDAADPDCNGRGVAPLPALVENNLSEFTVFDVTDVANQFVFKDSNVTAVRSPMDGDIDQDGPGDGDGDGMGDGVDWNSDGDTSDTGLTVNIDTADDAGTPGDSSDDRPGGCRNGVTDSTLGGFDDWTNISISFRQFGDKANGAINPVANPEISLPELLGLQRQLNTTDLVLFKSADPALVEVGEDLVYTLKLENRGANPASKVHLVDTLPDGVDYQTDDADCTMGAGNTLTCDLTEIAARVERRVTITVGTSNVCQAGLPRSIENSATVTNIAEYAGADTSPADNIATLLMTPVDTTPPNVVSPPSIVAECTSADGTHVNIGIATATDICDADLEVLNNAPSVFPLGVTMVRWSAEDESENVGDAFQNVLIEDTTPPDLDVSVELDTLWPPNHKLKTIRAVIVVSDACDANPVVSLVSITSNEADNGLGDGDTRDDIQGAAIGTNDREFQLRSERSGLGIGRVYTITYAATDASGNTSEQSVTVLVPRNVR